MKKFLDFKEDIHKCSKCGLCQTECPIYKISRNDCTVSRGQFVMLYGVIKGNLKLSKTINRYLDLCLKCNKCSKICPSGINVVDIIASAKSEYFNSNCFEKLKSFIQKYFIFGFFLKLITIFIKQTPSKKFDKKILYFGGCGSKLKTNKAIIKILNSAGIEVINPNFSCCGVPYFTRGDLKEYCNSIKNYIHILKKYNIKEVITTCASCEKSLKDYIKWATTEEIEFLKDIKIKNIYEYLKHQDVAITLKKPVKITYHQPCHLHNYTDIKLFLNKITNLEYLEMNDYNNCCGLNGIFKIKEYKIMLGLFKQKHKNIINSGSKIVLTSCTGCETALNLCSLGKYKVYDLLDFIGKNI